MVTRARLNWRVLDTLVPVLEKQGWTLAMIASDWGMTLSILEAHLRPEVSMSAISKHDYPALIDEYDQRRASGESHQAIRATFESRGINWGTFQNRRTQAKKAHPSTPQEHQETPKVHHSTPKESELLTVHPGTPEPTEIGPDEQYTQEHLGTLPETDSPEEHPGTLEGHQEVIEDISHSVPDAPHIGTDEEHPNTPVVHPEVSPDDSSTAHSGVPARQDHLISTPMVHPGTPTEEDWELWAVMKTRWTEVEKMLADWKTRQALLSTPIGTPRHTIKKTYVVDSLYVELIDRYAKEHSLDLKDVLNLAFQEFFERRDYRPPS
jgi:hypothetical protein